MEWVERGRFEAWEIITQALGDRTIPKQGNCGLPTEREHQGAGRELEAVVSGSWLVDRKENNQWVVVRASS